jgi:hypothetical protein
VIKLAGNTGERISLLIKPAVIGVVIAQAGARLIKKFVDGHPGHCIDLSLTSRCIARSREATAADRRNRASNSGQKPPCTQI